MTFFIDLVFICIGVIAALGLVVFLWNFGNRGTWGCLKDKYLDPNSEPPSFTDCESILIKSDDGWRYWNSCKVKVSSEGIYLGQPRIFKWIIPSLFIPAEDIKATYNFKKFIFKYTAISIDGEKYLLAIKASHFDV